MAYNRRRTRAENDRNGVLRHQERWVGENSDDDPSRLLEGQCQILENAVAFGNRVESRSGSWLYSATNPTGTSYGKFFHKPSKRWILHVGTKLYWSADLVTYTEITDYAAASFGSNSSSRAHTIFRNFAEGVLLCTQNGGIYFVNIAATTPKFFNATAKCPISTWPSAYGTAGHVYRYLFTFSRIEDGGANSSKRDAGGKVIHESGTPTNISGLGWDYSERWTEDPITSSNTIGIPMGSNQATVALTSSPHWNFLSIYRTQDIAAFANVNPATGNPDPTNLGGESLNDPNLYTWIDDVYLPTITSTCPSNIYSDGNADETIKSRISSNDGASQFILRSRGYFPVGCEARYDSTSNSASIEKFEVTPSFLLATQSGNRKKVDYCQLDQERFVGYHNPLQNKKFNQDVSEIVSNQLAVVFCHPHEMSGCDLNGYEDNGNDSSPMFSLQSFYPLDQTNGIVDYSSIAKTSDNKFIAVCSDKTVRIFDGARFGDDLADKQVSKRIKQIYPEGSVGKYVDDAYLLFYRVASASTYNDSGYRFALKENAGRGWTRLTGFVQPHLYHGGDFRVDSAGNRFLIIQDFGDKFWYWVETFDGYSDSGSIYKSIKDKGNVSNLASGTAIVSRLYNQDLIGELESFFVKHQQSQLHIFPQKPYSASNPNYTMDSNGFGAGFSINTKFYADGVLIDTVTGEPYNGEIESYKDISGNRVTVEYIINAGGWKVSREETRLRVIEKKKQIGLRDSTDAGYYTSLEANLRLWLSRGEFLDLERTLAKRYEVYGVASGLFPNASFSSVTGPDGKDGSAILFDDNEGCYLWGRTTPRKQWADEVIINGDFTFSFWLGAAYFNDPPLGSEGTIINGIASINNDFKFQLIATDTISTPFGNITIPSMPAVPNGSWYFFLFRRTAGQVTLQINGVVITSISSSITLGLGGDDVFIGGPGVCLFDVRLYDTFIQIASISSYRTDVTADEGKKVLPFF